jgi:hypothetical protein
MAKKPAKAAIVESPLAEKSLQQIAHCLAYLVLQADELKGKSNNDLIPLLAGLGFDRSSIASILQTTPETVSVRLSRLKTKSDSKSASKGKPENRSNTGE